MSNQNQVYIVGAGTGRVENLTVKAKSLIESADIIYYDRLINDNLLMLARRDCKKVYVGKKPEGEATSQDVIIQQLIDASKEYKKIVRLKSGDPYVFGRGGEEAIELEKNGINYEVVPGLSSSIAGLSYAGIPVTYRDVALDFHIFTARSKDGDAEHDWEAISRLNGTLIFMMGVKNLPKIANSLIEAGKEPTTPVAVVEWASRSQQKMIVGNLSTIYELALDANIQPPSIIVIGDVVQFNEQLNFFMNKPLFGKKVGIPQSQSKFLLPILENLGAEVVLFTSPYKVKMSIDLEMNNLEGTITFMDTTAVEAFIDWMNEKELDWRELSTATLIAVGQHTYSSLKKKGIIADQRFENINQFAGEELNEKAIYLGSDVSHQLYQTLIDSGSKYSQVITSQEKFEALENKVELDSVDCIIYSNTKAVRSINEYGQQFNNLAYYQAIPAYCLGSQSEKLLKDLGFSQVKKTKEENFESLQELLCEAYQY